MNQLEIEVSSRDKTFTNYLVRGLTVEEMNMIFDPQDTNNSRTDMAADIIEQHNPGLGKQWKCGYGIWDVKHFGEYLLVQVGNSCD